MKPRLKAYFLLFLVAVIWGIASPVIKYTLKGLSPLLFLTYRFGLSSFLAIILFPFLKIKVPEEKKVKFELLIYGFLTSTVSLGLLFWGLTKTTVLETTLITLINPLLISYFGILFLNEHVTQKEKLGMAIAFTGTVLGTFGPLLKNGWNTLEFSGNVLVFLYLLATAIGAVLAKKLLQKGVHPLILTNFSFIIGFLSLLPIAAINFQIGVLSNLPLNFHLGVIYMAFFREL